MASFPEFTQAIHLLDEFNLAGHALSVKSLGVNCFSPLAVAAALFSGVSFRSRLWRMSSA